MKAADAKKAFGAPTMLKGRVGGFPKKGDGEEKEKLPPTLKAGMSKKLKGLRKD